jgi:mannose-6-phosphate isomerase-like protein (cupin superfamily)
MVKSGDIIESAPTGERMVFRRTAVETDGAVVEFDLFVAPGGRPGAPHRHLISEERFDVLCGTVVFYVDGVEHKLGVGDTITIQAGVPHDFRNLGSEEVHMRGWVEPAHRFEELMETFFALSARDQTDETGRPGLLQTSAVLYRLRNEYRLEVVPLLVQRLAFPVLAALARMRGHPDVVNYPREERQASS